VLRVQRGRIMFGKCLLVKKPGFILDTDDEDLSQVGNVTYINNDFITMEDLFPPGLYDPDVNVVRERLLTYNLQLPYTVVIKSQMGSRKTTSLRKLVNEGTEALRALLGIPVVGPVHMLSISPRTLITAFTSTQLGFDNYVNVQDALNHPRGSKKTTNVMSIDNWDSFSQPLRNHRH
jgi:hypothetical protein